MNAFHLGAALVKDNDYLLKECIDANIEIDEYTLKTAILFKSRKCVEMLLNYGMIPTADSIRTAIHAGDSKILFLLLKFGGRAEAVGCEFVKELCNNGTCAVY